MRLQSREYDMRRWDVPPKPGPLPSHDATLYEYQKMPRRPRQLEARFVICHFSHSSAASFDLELASFPTATTQHGRPPNTNQPPNSDPPSPIQSLDTLPLLLPLLRLRLLLAPNHTAALPGAPCQALLGSDDGTVAPLPFLKDDVVRSAQQTLVRADWDDGLETLTLLQTRGR